MAENGRQRGQGLHEFVQSCGTDGHAVQTDSAPLTEDNKDRWEKVKNERKSLIEVLDKVGLEQWRKCLITVAGLQLMTLLMIMWFSKTGQGQIIKNGILYLIQAALMICAFFANKSEDSKSIYKLGKSPDTAIDQFQEAEYLQRSVRWINCCYVIMYLVLYPPMYHRYIEYPVALRVCAIANAAIVCLCSAQGLLRLTFRRWPNYVISAGNAILYLTVFDLLGAEDHFLGLFPFAIQSAVKHIEYMEIPVLEILAFIGVSAVVVEVYKKTVSGVYAEEPKSVTQGRKRARRKILSHWRYRNDRILFSGENVIIWLLAGTVVYLLVLIHAIRDYRADAVYLAIAGLVCYLSGILAHWNIDNDRLIQSEYSYLLTIGGKIKAEDVRDTSVRWRDFCQVLVEFYSSASSMNSEDYYLHDIGSLLINIHRNLKHDLCASEKFLCDILQAKGDVNVKIIRDASYLEDPKETSNVPKSNDLSKAQDILFSRDIVKLLDSYVGIPENLDPNKRLEDIPPLELLIRATNCFFDGQDESWTLRFSGCDIGSREGIYLLKVDTLINILQMHSYISCALRWLWCRSQFDISQMPRKCKECKGEESQTEFFDRCMADRMELMINYPMFVRQSFVRRWNKQFNVGYYADGCETYYWKLYNWQLYAGVGSAESAHEQIKMAIQRTITHALTSGEDLRYMDAFGEKLESGIADSGRYQKTQIYVSDIILPEDPDTCDEAKSWNAEKEKYKYFSPSSGNSSSDKVDYDRVFKIAYHLFYDSEKGA